MILAQGLSWLLGLENSIPGGSLTWLLAGGLGSSLFISLFCGLYHRAAPDMSVHFTQREQFHRMSEEEATVPFIT